MSNRHVYILAGVLAGLGLVLVLIRIFVLALPVFPGQQVETWLVEARVEFEGRNQPVLIELHIPANAPGFTVVGENFVSEEFGLRMRTPGANRQAVFSKRNGFGRHILFYQATVRRADATPAGAPAKQPEIPRPDLEGAALAAATAMAAKISQRSSDNASFQALLWTELLDAERGSEQELLVGRQPSRARIAEAVVAIAATAGLHARTVHGLELSSSRRDVAFNHWSEIFEDGKWIPYNPITGLNEAPADHLIWWRGRDSLVRLTGGHNLETSITVSQALISPLSGALAQSDAFAARLIELTVLGLPIQTQEVFRLLFVLPLGILLLVILRNVIGIKTFGTFLPVLVALSFRETGLAWGLALFAVVFVCGLSIRTYMDRLKLLIVPRMAIVATVVIITMAAVSIISFRLGIERGMSVSLFPIVILTMAIERMSIVLDESGTKEALTQAAGTVLAAVLAFAVMNIAFMEHFLFVFPESLLVLIAGMVLLGRYSGYRLSELIRFRVLARPKL